MNKISYLTYFLILFAILLSCSKNEGQIGPDAPPDALPDIVGS